MPSPDDLPRPFDPTTSGAATTAVDARSNGHGTGHGGPTDGGGPEPPRRPPGPSTKPALIVVGLTFLLFLIGVGLELLSGTQSRPTPSPTKIATARGAALHAVPARPLLKAIITAGQPPDDLLNAIAVPRGATPVPSSVINRGVESYDQSLRFEVPASQQNVISFFRAQLPAQHWKRLSQGPTGTGGTQYLILAQHPASDGLEWDIGVTVAPTFFSSPTAPPGSAAPGSAATAPSSDTTSFSLRLYSVSDQD
jgi:hypothetical protein